MYEEVEGVYAEVAGVYEELEGLCAEVAGVYADSAVCTRSLRVCMKR